MEVSVVTHSRTSLAEIGELRPRCGKSLTWEYMFCNLASFATMSRSSGSIVSKDSVFDIIRGRFRSSIDLPNWCCKREKGADNVPASVANLTTVARYGDCKARGDGFETKMLRLLGACLGQITCNKRIPGLDLKQLVQFHLKQRAFTALSQKLSSEHSDFHVMCNIQMYPACYRYSQFQTSNLSSASHDCWDFPTNRAPHRNPPLFGPQEESRFSE